MATNLMQRSWWSAMAETVKSVCSLVIDVSDTLNDGVSMASASVAAARERQIVDLEISSEGYEREAKTRASLQHLATLDEVAAIIGNDQAKAQEFQKEFDRLSASIANAKKLVAAKKAERRS